MEGTDLDIEEDKNFSDGGLRGLDFLDDILDDCVSGGRLCLRGDWVRWLV